MGRKSFCVNGLARFCAVFAAAAAVFSSNANNNVLIARVPVRVSVAATVVLTPPPGVVEIPPAPKVVAAGVWDTLHVMAPGVSVLRGSQVRSTVPAAARYNNGVVSVQLRPQQYSNAAIALYTINGKRVMSGNASASGSAFNISRSNIAPGVYLLSVKSDGGNSYSTRFTHRGGRLNINAAFGGANATLRKEAAPASDDDEGLWELTATPTVAGYHPYSKRFALFHVLTGNIPHDITFVLDGSESVTPGDPVTYGGQTYWTVVIGSQTWFTNNLNYAGNDNNIGVCYDNMDSNCDIYGRLYTWAEAMGSNSLSGGDVKRQGICPPGWHIPSEAEWETLITTVGGRNTAGGVLKSQSYWNPWEDISSTDQYDFSALPGGRGYGSNSFGEIGDYGHWWSATRARGRHMLNWFNNVTIQQYSTSDQLSVRCLKD